MCSSDPVSGEGRTLQRQSLSLSTVLRKFQPCTQGVLEPKLSVRGTHIFQDPPVSVSLSHSVTAWGAWLSADSLVDAKRSPGVAANHEGHVFMAATMLSRGSGTF